MPTVSPFYKDVRLSVIGTIYNGEVDETADLTLRLSNPCALTAGGLSYTYDDTPTLTSVDYTITDPAVEIQFGQFTVTGYELCVVEDYTVSYS